jgi:hypothetical protein
MVREQLQTAARGRSSFVCPHCGALAQQTWANVYISDRQVENPINALDPVYLDKVVESEKDVEQKRLLARAVVRILSEDPEGEGVDGALWGALKFDNVFTSQCFACHRRSIWLRDRIIYPETDFVIEPNPDLPNEVLVEFNEAASIFSRSPRGASALLRLAIQRLCNWLGKEGDINQMIGELVAEGLNARIQKALDIVRVIGNESVHPGTVDVRDTPEIAEQLFRLVNIIAEKMISEPKHIDQLYSTLPPGKLSGINNRDKKALTVPAKGKDK